MLNTQVSRKHVFLTYQHLEREGLDHSTQSLNTFTEWVLAEFPVDTYSIGLEHYPSEPGVHIHCLLTFVTKHTCQRLKFNFKSIAPYFESLTTSRASLRRVHAYCQKDGLFTSNFDPREEETDKNEKWRTALTFPTRKEALVYLQTNFPRHYVLQYPAITRFLNGHYRADSSEYTPPEGQNFRTNPQLDSWVEENIKPSEPVMYNLFLYCVTGFALTLALSTLQNRHLV